MGLHCDSSGPLCGLMGALLLLSPTRLFRYGGVAFLLANIATRLYGDPPDRQCPGGYPSFIAWLSGWMLRKALAQARASGHEGHQEPIRCWL